MAYKVITAVTVEPVTVAEAMSVCRIDESNQEPAPDAVTCALAAPPVSGDVDNGAHRYRVTFVTAAGETQGGTISASVTVADKTVNGKVSLTGIPLGGSLVTSRKLYRTAAGGSTYLLLATIADNTTTTYTDNIADSALGAEAPSTNSTADPELLSLITTAREFAEHEVGRALAPQTLELALDEFGDDEEIQLPMMPVASITSVKYYDTDGVLQTMDSADYALHAYGADHKIALSYGESWPSTRSIPNAVQIRYVTGYGAAGHSATGEYAVCPKAVKQGLLLQIKLEYPGNVFAPGEREQIERARDALLNTKKIWGW